MARLWHRIVATPIPGMATSDTLDGQPTTSAQSILVNRFPAILRATWCETTTGRQRPPERLLVEPYQTQTQPFHRPESVTPARPNNSATAESTSSKEEFFRAVRATNTRSEPARILSSRGRTASRISRLARDRFTAPPTRRLAETPTRTRSRSLVDAPNTSHRLNQAQPDTRTRSKSLLRRKRFARGIPTAVSRPSN
jgi:hypothetical protein